MLAHEVEDEYDDERRRRLLVGGGGGDLAHDQLADQPEWVTAPSVVNRTRM
jgi:hypothetical protein